MTLLPELRDELVRAAARPRRRTAAVLVPAFAALLAVAAVVAVARPGADDSERPAATPTPTPVAGPFSVFRRPAGPYDRLPPGQEFLAARHRTRRFQVRRIVLWGGKVGYVSRGGGRICTWADLGNRCDSERNVVERGLVNGDPGRMYVPEGRVVVAGFVPDRVLRVAVTGLRRGGDVARVPVRENAFRVNVPYAEGIAGYTLIERGDADQWSLQTLPGRHGRLIQEPLRRCPPPYPVADAWRVQGVPCAFVGEYVGKHFEPHPPPYTIDKAGFACHVPRNRNRRSGPLRASCTDGYRRFSFVFH